MNIIQYEDAQARLEEEMRRAAVWRMQRKASDLRRSRKNQSTQSGWLQSIGKAFSAVRSTSGKSVTVDAGNASGN